MTTKIRHLRSVLPVEDRPTSEYPPRPKRGPVDGSRRRFLRQCAGAAGAASILSAFGVPRLAHGQSVEVDFAHLSAHPRNVSEASPSVQQTVDQSAVAEGQGPGNNGTAQGSDGALAEGQGPGDNGTAQPLAEDMLAARGTEALAAEGPSVMGLVGDDSAAAGFAPAAPTDEFGSGDDVEVAVTEEITENRALWVEPGYLVLLRWRRPVSDEANSVIAALEGSVDDLADYFASTVTSGDELHNLDRLHEHELFLLSFLEPLVTPAVIEVVHLDHDCATVCSNLEPIGPFPDTIIVGGIAPSPSY